MAIPYHATNLWVGVFIGVCLCKPLALKHIPEAFFYQAEAYMLHLWASSGNSLLCTDKLWTHRPWLKLTSAMHCINRSVKNNTPLWYQMITPKVVTVAPLVLFHKLASATMHRRLRVFKATATVLKITQNFNTTSVFEVFWNTTSARFANFCNTFQLHV